MTFSIDPRFLAIMTGILITEAFFSGSEMALISADRLALKRKANAGSHGAKLALNLIGSPERMLATVLLGTNLCILSQGAIATIYIHRIYGGGHDLNALAFLTPIILVFGELIPKTIFQKYADELATWVSFPITVVQLVLSPILKLITRYTSWLSLRIGELEDTLGGKRKESRRDVLTYLLTHGRKEISLKNFESKMIHRILHFSRSATKNALIPLVNVDAIEDTATVEDALKVFSLHRHSRIPIYRDRIDNIVGIVHIFDLLDEPDHQKPITEFMKAPFFAPESQKVDDLMVTMQHQGIQMAVVVDEYGGAVGIVTLEDLIEEIVGEISDEYDSDSSLYKQISENEYLIQGSMEIEAINEQLKLRIPAGHYETLAGFLLLQFNRIPDEGDELYFQHLRFIIKQRSSKAIKLIAVTRID